MHVRSRPPPRSSRPSLPPPTHRRRSRSPVSTCYVRTTYVQYLAFLRSSRNASSSPGGILYGLCFSCGNTPPSTSRRKFSRPLRTFAAAAAAASASDRGGGSGGGGGHRTAGENGGLKHSRYEDKVFYYFFLVSPGSIGYIRTALFFFCGA